MACTTGTWRNSRNTQKLPKHKILAFFWRVIMAYGRGSRGSYDSPTPTIVLLNNVRVMSHLLR